ncbi:MAG: TadE/TadG family type IV pilus assembly protein [Terriglobia bacterium]
MKSRLRTENHKSRSGLRSCHGQYMVEVATVLPLLLLLTFAIIDFSTLFYVYLSLENGISQATRYGITGQQLSNPDPLVGGTLSRIDSIKLAMKQATPTLTFSASNPQFTFEHLVAGSWTAYGGTEDAKGNDVMRVTVLYHWDLMTPLIRPFFTGGGIDLRVTSSVKNEGFL